MAQTPQTRYACPGLAKMHLPDFSLLVISAVAAIAAGLAVLTSNYRVTRVLFWIAAIAFGSLGVVWSATSEGHSLATQMIVSAIVGALAASGLAWAIWEVRTKEGPQKPKEIAVVPALPPSPAPQRGPTLEANSGGKIDATGAVIPGDLPYQVAKTETGGLIDMPGIVITRKEDGAIGFEASGKPVNRTFPPPSGEFSKLNSQELVQKLVQTAIELRALDKEQSDQFDAVLEKYGRPSTSPPPEIKAKISAEMKVVSERFLQTNEKYAGLSQSLASECMTRIPPIESSSMSRPVYLGASNVYHRRFVGWHPALNAALFLDFLADKLKQQP